MSPMIDIQQRHSESFRIRLGDRGENGAPRKLTDAIRVTSFGENTVLAFCEVYGGEVRPWSSPKGAQFEAYLPTTSLHVMVLPGQSIDQWWERYRGSAIDRRCDGCTETLTNKPCLCPPDVDVRVKTKDACRPMTRLSVMCPDVQVLGSGSLVTHGLIAAETLPQSIKIAEAALARGVPVPATLRVIKHEGRTHYIYPILELGEASFYELMAAGPEVGQRMVQRGAQRALARGSLAALPSGPRVASRLDRPESRVVDGGGPPLPPLPHEEGGVSVVGASSRGPGSETTDRPPVNRVAIAAREAGLDDDGRHDLAEWASDGRVRSSALLTDVEVGHALIAAGRVKDGSAKLIRDADNVILLKDCRYGWPITRSGVPDDPHMTMPLDELRTDLRGRIEALGDDGKKAWKDAGLPALTKLADEHRERALRCVASLEPF